ncbi:putative bifunctional diguanylate cyclase/phosphodiesterase [Chiayiivirga flava]|uniref:Diguanylate cyclase (GGDEF)-like protein n=1 Tax=Chiayiivirga flava TaxID=659595 RepID=A0A7W8D5S7_9GAMM|nr:EAL domain-containing protein [Chiayiivirga flava]MBB5207315.1 diguanylate cyclase (GGDEF)-like protein [Chiayiivirga flava]
MTPPIRAAARFLLLVAAYVAAAGVALFYVDSPNDITLIWPSTGIAYGALLVFGLRWWPFAAVAVLLTHLLLAPAPWLFVPYSIASNVLGGLLGAGYVRRFHPHALGRLSLGTGWVLMAGGAIMAVTSAVIGSAGMVHAGMVAPDLAVQAALRWLMGDLFGIIAVTPAMLLLALPAPRILHGESSFRYGGVGEKTLLAASLGGGLAVVLWAGDSGNGYALALTSLPLAALILSAVRFEPVFTAVANAAMSMLLATVAGLGLAGFTPPATLGDSALLTLFMCVIALIPQLLSVTIFENRLASSRLIRRATTDPLTGVANRTAFEAHVRGLVQAGPGEPMALAYIDMDRFRIVNDTLGHAVGDSLIAAVSGVLESRLAPGDVLARVGGDAFAVLLRHCDVASALQRTHDLRDAVAAYRFVSDAHVSTSTVSIGVVPFRADDVEFSTLLAQADTACFAAKERGGNRVVALEPGRQGEVHERSEAMRWALRIDNALEHDHFRLFCQTIAPLRAVPGEQRHFEILLRMRDPDSGDLLLPGQFVPAAERFGLGVRLDRHVIDRTLRWFERHPDSAANVSLCAINLTAASIEDEAFLPFLQARLQRSVLPAHRLCFELTETSALRDLARAQALIQSVRALGCRFALDDFGTGFCSFGYLRSLDVDFFKIDGSFVKDVATSTLSYAIVRSIADIGRVMRKQTIAECAESESVRQRLGDLGVDYAQGYAISAPEPIERYFGTSRRAAVG